MHTKKILAVETLRKDMEYSELTEDLTQTECNSVLGFRQPTPLSGIKLFVVVDVVV